MGGAFTSSAEIQCSWAEICRAAVTVGRRNWPDILRFGTYSILECMWRLAMVRANLVEDPSARLKYSKAFDSLDPSEKGAVSYFFGLIFTKLIAEKLFGVSWLMHLDVYTAMLNPTLALNGKPDFVGCDQSYRWIVIESKGRTGGVTSDLLDSAKYQTRCLRKIGGAFPTLRVALATYFSTERLRAKLRDPDEYEPDAPDIPISLPDFLREYYRPILELITSTPHDERLWGDRKYIRANLPGMDASVNLDSELFSLFTSPALPRQLSFDWLPSSTPILEEIDSQRALDDSARINALKEKKMRGTALGTSRLELELPVGYDGIFIELGRSWNAEYMRREPHERGQ